MSKTDKNINRIAITLSILFFVSMSFFVWKLAHASVVYTQAIDNSGAQEVDAYANPTANIGTFSLYASTTFGYNASLSFIYQTLAENPASNPSTTLVGTVYLETAGSPCNQATSVGVTWNFGYGIGDANLANNVDGQWRSATLYLLDNSFATTTLPVGNYQICVLNSHGASGLGQNKFEVAVSSFNNSLYGTITENGSLSLNTISGVPAVPTLPNESNFISQIESGNLNTGIPLLDQYATATASSAPSLNATNFLSFLNVPQLLATRVPFAYIVQIYGALTSALSTASSSGQLFPTTTLNLGFPTSFSASGAEVGSTSLSINYFSTSTLTEIMGPTVLAVIRTLLGAIVYVELGMWLWRDARSKKHLF